jgi:phenylalanyl-tRNA synthetase beta chain
MNISHHWLRDVAPSLTGSVQEIADRLAMLGAPVDEIVALGAELGDVVIARVDAVGPHPNADRLRLCTVNAGGETLQVVCGAPNVEAGRYYPFAPVGARLPGGVEIRRAKLRGERSEGMLCSARELGLGRDHAGLMTLAGEWEPGSSFLEQLHLDDHRLVVDVTPNRPDLLSHLGVARELAPGGVDELRLEPFGALHRTVVNRSAVSEGEVGGVRVAVEDPVGCPRYLAAVVRGLKVGPSPEWLAARLRAVGLRPINNVVDATNFVLHETGQPLHAFDLARLAGPAIVVRAAREGERITTLDGIERALGPADLVIADAERPVALAGVMGGEESEVTAETTELLLECALFEPQRVRRTARRLGLSTDASYRFERGVDPELQPMALWRVLDLVLAVAGGEAEPAFLDVGREDFRRQEVVLRPERVGKLLGVEMDAPEIASLLRPIGFEVQEAAGDALRVEVPGWRPDVTREADLIEELARRRGYDSFPEALRPFRPSNAPEDPMVPVMERVHRLFGRWGLLEARTLGFAPETPGSVPLLNPLSQEEGSLRGALVPGLLRRLEHNWAHGVRDVRLYEIGTVFAPAESETGAHEEVRVAAVLTGARVPPHWSEEARAWDLWDVKALLEELASELALGAPSPGESGDVTAWLDAAEHFLLPAPARGAAGKVAAGAADAPAWAEPVYALEVTLPTSLGRRPRVYRALPEYPAVERDLALLVPEAVPAATVESAIREGAGEMLETVWPFDRYAGKGIPEGTRSLAFRLRFRLPERTLTDAEVDRAVERVLTGLAERDVRRR